MQCIFPSQLGRQEEYHKHPSGVWRGAPTTNDLSAFSALKTTILTLKIGQLSIISSHSFLHFGVSLTQILRRTVFLSPVDCCPMPMIISLAYIAVLFHFVLICLQHRARKSAGFMDSIVSAMRALSTWALSMSLAVLNETMIPQQTASHMFSLKSAAAFLLYNRLKYTFSCV